jgi:hypothetical protein
MRHLPSKSEAQVLTSSHATPQKQKRWVLGSILFVWLCKLLEKLGHRLELSLGPQEPDRLVLYERLQHSTVSCTAELTHAPPIDPGRMTKLSWGGNWGKIVTAVSEGGGTCMARCQFLRALEADDRDKLAQLPCELLLLEMLLWFSNVRRRSFTGDFGLSAGGKLPSSWSARHNNAISACLTASNGQPRALEVLVITATRSYTSLTTA